MRNEQAAIDLIQKLHEITVENGATPAEAERAAGHAARLLAEHNLSMFDVESKTFDETVVEEVRWYDSKNRHPWISDLASCIGRPLDCRVFFGRNYQPGKIKITFVGHKSDAAVASYLWDTLSPVLYDMGTKSGRNAGRTAAALVAYRNQFIRHAGYAISQRLHQEKENVEVLHEAETSTAMVHVKTAAVTEFIETVPSFAKAKFLNSSASDHDEHAKVHGHRAGKTIPIRKGIETTESKLIGG